MYELYLAILIAYILIGVWFTEKINYHSKDPRYNYLTRKQKSAYWTIMVVIWPILGVMFLYYLIDNIAKDK